MRTPEFIQSIACYVTPALLNHDCEKSLTLSGQATNHMTPYSKSVCDNVDICVVRRRHYVLWIWSQVERVRMRRSVWISWRTRPWTFGMALWGCVTPTLWVSISKRTWRRSHGCKYSPMISGQDEARVLGTAAGSTPAVLQVPGRPKMVCWWQGDYLFIFFPCRTESGHDWSSNGENDFSMWQITFVDFIMYELLDQHRMFHPTCLDDFKNLKDLLDRFEVRGKTLLSISF